MVPTPDSLGFVRQSRPPARSRSSRAAATTTLALAVVLTAGCAPETKQSAGQRPLQVVAGFYPVYEAARRVGGERVEVTNLTASGAEPHDLELTSRQVDLVEDADVILYVGGGFQPALQDAAARVRGGVDLLEGGDVLDADPHIWLDPVRFRGVAERIRRVLTEADPQGAPTYEAGAAAFARELETLHHDFETRLASCRSRLLVTSHGAFRYLAERYQLEPRSIAGLSPDEEPDPARLAELTDLVKARGVTTLFSETLASPGLAETLARETGAGTAVLNPVEGLTEAEQRAGANYVSLMRDNLEALAAGLGCS
jgi:zinc transport system substrate-binding protein